MARVTGIQLGGVRREAHELLRSEWDYNLYQTGFGLVLSTLCGSVALYDICILLTDDESLRFQNEGEVFLKDLAKRVREDHTFVAERRLANALEWEYANQQSPLR